MARTTLLLALLACVLAASHLRVARGASAPAPSPDCITLVVSELVPCFDYATNASVTKPSSDCCKDLKSFVKATPSCICVLLSEASSLASQFGVNATKVMMLPDLCKVDAKMDQCKTIAMPPAGAPSAGGGGSPSPSGGTASPPGSNKASTFWVSSGALLAGIAAAAFAAL